jgi:hypothetical protein
MTAIEQATVVGVRVMGSYRSRQQLLRVTVLGQKVVGVSFAP